MSVRRIDDQINVTRRLKIIGTIADDQNRLFNKPHRKIQSRSVTAVDIKLQTIVMSEKQVFQYEQNSYGCGR